MNTILIMIAVILLMALLTDVYLFLKQRNRSAKLQVLQERFSRLVKKHQLLIHYKDVFNKRIIGLDRKQNKLVLLDANAESCLHLETITACNLVQLKNRSNKIKKVFLEIVRTENKEPVRFCFYDDVFDSSTEKTWLLLKAKDWSQRLTFHKKYWWLQAKEYA